MKCPPLLFGVSAFAVFIISPDRLIAQTASNPSNPGDSGAAPARLVNGSPTAGIQFANGSTLSVRSKAGRFPLVGASSAENINVQLRFTAKTDTRLVIQSLDGGTVVSGTDSSVAADGTASVQLKMGSQPGFYRFVLQQGGSVSLVQFWVADPQSPDAGPSALQPSTGI